jgi:hypothetical protein
VGGGNYEEKSRIRLKLSQTSKSSGTELESKLNLLAPLLPLFGGIERKFVNKIVVSCMEEARKMKGEKVVIESNKKSKKKENINRV